MEQRQHHRQAITLDRCEDNFATADVVQQIAVREHRALGPAGGAGRVDDNGEVLRRTVHHPGRSSGRTRQHIRDRQQPERGELGREFRCAGNEFRIRQQHVQVGVAHHVFDLGRLEEIVDGHHDRAGGEDAVVRGDKLRGVVMPQTHAIPGAHAQRVDQSTGDPAHLFRELVVAHFALAPADRGFAGVLGRACKEDTMQASVRNGHGRH